MRRARHEHVSVTNEPVYCPRPKIYASSQSTTERLTIYTLHAMDNNTQGGSDVISSYHIYASCFFAMLWGKLGEMFVIATDITFVSPIYTIQHVVKPVIKPV